MTPRTVADLFPSRWLKAADLAGRPVTVTIRDVTIEELHNPRTNRSEARAIVEFIGKTKRLILNKTQATALAAITGSPTFSEWHSHRVTLAPGRTRNGHDTIVLSPPPAASNGQVDAINADLFAS